MYEDEINEEEAETDDSDLEYVDLSSDDGRVTIEAFPHVPPELLEMPDKENIEKQQKEIEDYYYSSPYMQRLIFSDDVGDHKRVPVFDRSKKFSYQIEKKIDIANLELKLAAVAEANERFKADNEKFKKKQLSLLRQKKERRENMMMVKAYRKAEHAVTVPATYIKEKADIDFSKPETKTDGCACICVLLIVLSSVALILGLYKLLEQPLV